MKLNKEVVKGSIILLIGVNIFSALGFIFQLSMARLLTLAEYGVLATLFSILYFLGLFTESLQTLVAQYASRESNTGKIKNVLKRTLRKALFLSLVLFIVYLIAAVPLSHILEIPFLLIVFTGLFIFASLLVPASRGIMQGTGLFTALSLNVIIEGIVKLCAGVAFVYWGLSIYGAVGGAMLGTFMAFIFSFIPLREILKTSEKRANSHSINVAAKPTFFVILVVMIFYSIDIIVAKSVFSPEVAGAYAIASVISKALFWGTQPISKVMFPLSSRKNNLSRGSNVFVNSFFLLGGILVAALLVFYFAPAFLVKLFSGKEVAQATLVLFNVGVAMSLISIANLILLYKLSMGKVKRYYLLPLCLLLEVGLLYYFSSNLVEFSIAFITSSAVLVWASARVNQ